MMYYTGSTHSSEMVTIRAAHSTDGAALRRIAERDGRVVPDGELVLAEVDGEAQAAIALATGEVIADPFRPTAELVRMLSLRRGQLRSEVRSSGRHTASPALSAHLSWAPTRR
jgi:hypothetical protein